jgi:hypothetical protein
MIIMLLDAAATAKDGVLYTNAFGIARVGKQTSSKRSLF